MKRTMNTISRNDQNQVLRLTLGMTLDLCLVIPTDQRKRRDLDLGLSAPEHELTPPKALNELANKQKPKPGPSANARDDTKFYVVIPTDQRERRDLDLGLSAYAQRDYLQQ